MYIETIWETLGENPSRIDLLERNGRDAERNTIVMMMLEEERGRRNVFIDGEPSCNTRFQSCKYIVDDLDSLSSFVFLCSPNSTSGLIEYFSGTHKKEEEDSNGKCPRSDFF